MAITESTAERYMLQDPDVRLMLEVRDDNAASFEELMLRYQNRLIAVLEHLVGKRDLAEDLAQEVFMRVYRARKRYIPGSKFSTWLFTIANNVALNALRSLSRRPEVHLQPSRSGSMGANPIENIKPAASAQMPSRVMDQVETQDMVRAAVSTLNERQRMAVLLAKFEQLSYAEIGEIMDMSPQAIKSLLSRARANLRDVLTPYMENGSNPGGPK